MAAGRGLGAKGTFDPSKMYDVTEDELRAIQERAKTRAALKADFQKKLSNPFRGVGGYVFDPAVQRFLSMRANHWEQFHPTPKNFAIFFGMSIAPILLLWWKIEKDKRDLDRACRNGEVAYRDRRWKFVQ